VSAGSAGGLMSNCTRKHTQAQGRAHIWERKQKHKLSHTKSCTPAHSDKHTLGFVWD